MLIVRMNKLKNILLNHFNECAVTISQKNSNEVLFKDVILIILGYCTPYYELTSTKFNCGKHSYDSMTTQSNDTTVFRTLTNNRVAIGYNDGTICIWDLINNIKITRPSPTFNNKDLYNKIIPYTISEICQVDNNIIVYGFKNFDYIIVWDFENGTNKGIKSLDIQNCKIISLEKDLIIVVHIFRHLITLNLKTSEKINYVNYNTHHVSLLYNKIIMSYRIHDKLIIKSTDKTAFNSSIIQNEIIYENELEKYTKLILFKSIPCFNKFNSKNVLNNNIIIVKGWQEQMILNNTILLCNAETKKSITIIENIKGYINSIIYLNNGYFAMLINGVIMIYHIPTKLCIQTIKNMNDYVFLEPYNNGFITVDSISNATIYE
jgi:hypothetical protein